LILRGSIPEQRAAPFRLDGSAWPASPVESRIASAPDRGCAAGSSTRGAKSDRMIRSDTGEAVAIAPTAPKGCRLRRRRATPEARHGPT
jgi:hypothetical protein